jgi:hypothetical protein
MTDADLATHPNEAPASPRRRKRLVLGLGLLVLALAAAWYAFLYHATNRRLSAALAAADRLDPGWHLEELEARRTDLPEEENSAVRVRAIHRLLPLRWPDWEYPVSSPESQAADRERVVLRESFEGLDASVLLDGAQSTALRAELQRAESALHDARMVEAMPRGRYRIAWSPDFFSTALPHLQEAAEVARLLGFDALLRGHEGNPDGALASCRAALNCLRSIGDEPTLISQLVRAARGVWVLRQLERTLAHGEPSRAALEATQRLVAQEAEEPWFLVGLRGDRAVRDLALVALERGDTSPGQLRAAVGRGGGGGSGLLAQAGESLRSGSVRANRAATLEFVTEAVEIAKLPDVEQARRFRELQDRIRKLPNLSRELWAPFFAFTEIVQYRAEFRCGVALLAAERFRQDQGRWPASLAELVPAYLPWPLLDPFDGQPLRLGRFAQGIVIYSVGDDGTDDGGNLRGLSRRPHPGTDLGFRLWDVKHRRQPPPAVAPAGP